MTEPNARAPMRRLARWGLRALIMIAVLVVGIKIALKFIDFGPLIAREVTQAIGLTMQIGRLDNYAIPGAKLIATGVTLGEGDFAGRAETVIAEGSLLRLATKHVKVERGVIEGFHVQFPETFTGIVDGWEAAEARVAARKAKSKPATPSATPPTPATAPAAPANPKKDDDWKVEFNDVTAEDTVVYMGAAIAMRGDIYGYDLLTDRMRFKWQTDMPRFGGRAHMTGESFLIETDGDPLIDGKAMLYDFSTYAMGAPLWLPEGLVDAGVTAKGSLASDLEFDIEGDLRVPEDSGLAGAFSGSLWIQDGRVTINGVQFAGPGLDGAGDLTWETDGRVACHIATLAAHGAGLTALASLAFSERGVLHATGDGQLLVEDFLFGTGDDGAFRFVQGHATLSGIGFALPDDSMAFGELAGEASVQEGAIQIAELRGDGLIIRGAARPDWSTGALAVDLSGEIELTPGRLAPWLPGEAIESLSGRVTAERFAAALGSGRPITEGLLLQARLDNVSSALRVEGFDAPVVCENVSGGIAYENGVFGLSGLRGEGFAADGAITSDPVTGAVTVDLSGELDLGGGLLALVLPSGLLSELGGTASFRRIAAAFAPDSSAPQNLSVEGAIRDGRAMVNIGDVHEKWSEVVASFVTAGDHVETTIDRINSERLGVVSGGVAYGTDDNAVHGTLTLDFARIPELLFDAGETRRQLAPLFAVYGRSTVDLSLQMPQSATGNWIIEVKRHGDPALSARVVIAHRDKTTVLDEIKLDAAAPARALDAFLPGGIEADGAIALRMDKVAGDTAFVVEANLEAASLALGKRLQKRTGDAMSAVVRGNLDKDGWRLRSADLECLGQRLSLEFTSQGVRAPAVDIDLAGLVRLLPDGGTARGRVQGDWTPPTGRFLLADADVSLAPGAEIDSISGEVVYEDGYLLCNNVQVTGADSDCTINAQIQNGLWEADVSGQKLDLDAINALIDTVRSVSGQDTASPAATGSPAAPAPERAAAAVPDSSRDDEQTAGRINVYLNSLFYRRGRLDDVRAEVLVRPHQLVFQNLTFRPYSGQVRGAFIITQDGGPGRLDLDLTLEGADLRLLDDLAFEEPREMAGIVNGAVKLAFPLGDAVQSLKGVSGRMELDISKGTYGKLGTVTQALGFFRVFEFIRLSVPQLQHKGLAFDKSLVTLSAEDGVVALNSLTLTSKSYAMDGFGTVNYRDDTMDVTIRVNLLELVTGLITHVPVIGSAVDRLSSIAELVVKGSGSPFTPEFSLAPGIGQRRPGKDKDESGAPENGAAPEAAPEPA